MSSKMLTFYDDKERYLGKYSIDLTDWQKEQNYKWRVAIMVHFLRDVSSVKGIGIGVYNDFSDLKRASFYESVKKNLYVKQAKNASEFLCIYNFSTKKIVAYDLEKISDKDIFKETMKIILPKYKWYY